MTYYKGFDKDLKCYCGSFQYEVGKTYYTGYNNNLKEDDLCTDHVFHFCDSIENVGIYYGFSKGSSNRLCEVEPLGNIISDGEKFGTNKLKIVREITGKELDYLTGNGTNEDLVKRFHELYDNKSVPELATVNVGCKWNFAIGTDGKYLSEQWFDDCGEFHEGYSRVKMDGKWNFIGKDGKYASEQWFDDCWDFREGYAKVELNGKYNFIGTDGKYLSDQWFDYCYNFSYGYAKIELNGKYNSIGKDGKYVSDQWLDLCYDFNDGYVKVELSGKWNFSEEYAAVKLNGEWKLLGKDGKILNYKIKTNMKYYKGFDKELKCFDGFQYEVGKTCDTGYRKDLSENDLCTDHVFHFSDSVENVNDFYLMQKEEKNRLCEVEPLGNIITDEIEFGTNKLNIVREITGDEFDYLTGNGTNEDLVKRFHELYDEKDLKKLDKAQVGCKYNFADGNGSVISPDQWFDRCGYFIEGYAKVKMNGKWNFIGTDGKYLSDRWFDDCSYFSEGYVAVKLNEKWNYIGNKGNGGFIGKDGKYLSDRWFDWAYNFSEGYAAVILDEKYNFIGKDGKYASEQWFDDCWDFREGYAKIELNGKYNSIGKDGKYLSDQWFDDCGYFIEGYAKIVLNDKYNFIGKDGKGKFVGNGMRYISDLWFDNCCDFREGYANVKLNGKWNSIGKDGKYLSDQWFDECYSFSNGYAAVRLNGEWKLLGKDGKLKPLAMP